MTTVLLTASAAALFLAGYPQNSRGENQPASKQAVTADDSALRQPDSSGIAESTTGNNGRFILDVTPLLQDNNESACEIYAAVSLLNYYGFSVDDNEFIENYLHTEPLGTYDGVYCGPSLYSAFAGTAQLGYGVYAPSLEGSVNKYLSDNRSGLTAKTETECTLEDLCREHVSSGKPVIIWGTTDMLAPVDYVYWTIDYADENSDLKVGDIFSWPTTEHCMLLMGFDDYDYFFADSLDGTVVSYPKQECQEAFEALGSQAIYLS